jgi:hypothetical protein
MPEEFVAPDDHEEILRSQADIERAEKRTGLGATPNEVAAGLAEPDYIIPAPKERAKQGKLQREQSPAE